MAWLILRLTATPQQVLEPEEAAGIAFSGRVLYL